MSDKFEDIPAFPLPEGCGAYHKNGIDGMSLRDWFATNAETLADETLSSIIEDLAGPAPCGWDSDPVGYLKWVSKADAVYRYIQADAMMEARKK